MNFSNSFHHSFPLCLQLTILQQRGRALGCSPGPWVAPGMKQQRSLRLRAQSGTGCEKSCVALKAKKLHEHPPQEGSGNIATLYCTCRNGGSCLEKTWVRQLSPSWPGDIGFPVYLYSQRQWHSQPLHKEKWSSYLQGLFSLGFFVAKNAGNNNI